MLIDSHCHLDMLNLDAYNGDLGLLLKQAKSAGVERFISIGVDLEQSKNILSLAVKYPEVKVSVGLHPSEFPEVECDTKTLLTLAADSNVVAIGEIGLDYYDRTGQFDALGKERQRQRLREQIRVALEVNKPLILHSRAAGAELVQILKEEGAAKVGGVLHCFTEDWEIAEQVLALNFVIGITGILTFKNAEKLRGIARRLPLEKILLETDAPYLAPEPKRGKSNEPAYLVYVAEYLAKLKQVPLAEVAAATTENCFRIFGKW
jgi:TatD DNase family protein